MGDNILMYDFAIIGGGIIGLSTGMVGAMLSVRVLEKLKSDV